MIRCLILLFSFCLSYSVMAQEPDYEMEPYVFNNETSTIGDVLPIENAFEKVKAGASLYIVGVGNVNSYFYIKGNESPLSINKKEEQIIINTGGVSPRQSISVIKLQIVGNKRRWKTGTLNVIGATTNEEDVLPIKFKKFGENSSLVDISDLPAGQYCIGITKILENTKSSKVYTFSIEEDQNDQSDQNTKQENL